jgi:DNA-3-methyladenine glycosylase
MKPQRLNRQFYIRPTLTVAKELLGKYLVRKIGKNKLVGKIVETEAYIGPEDRASHAYGGKITERCKTEYLEGGHIYIYLCYGMYWQLNITTSLSGKPECVLIRALEPVENGQKFKVQKAKCSLKSFALLSPRQKPRQMTIKNSKLLRKLASGPGKLCRWLKLDKSFDGEDLTESKRIWLEDRSDLLPERIKKSQIIATKRIGIEYSGIWKDKPWRFYIKGNPFISRR